MSIPESRPKEEYGIRLRQRLVSATKCETLHHRIGNARLTVFLAAAAIAWLSLKGQLFSPWLLLLPAAVFTGLIVWHSRVLQELQLFKRAAEFYQQGVARLEERWEGTGTTGAEYNDPSHPFAQDLDLFGKGSLFELLCSARTRAGEQMLASWLKSPAAPDEIRSRQAAVDELRPRLAMREDLAVLGPDVQAGVEPDLLTRWGQEPTLLKSGVPRIMAGFLGLAGLVTLGIWITMDQHRWFFLTILVEALFFFVLRRDVRHTVGSAERAGSDLKLLAQLLARLEKEQFQTSRLRQLASALHSKDMAASDLIRHLNRLLVLLDSRRNPFFAPVAFVLLWEVQLAYFVEDWRRKNGRAIAGWLSTVAEFEALSCLAGYAYEHPDDPFPELSDESPCFDSLGLGHPLLHESKCVRNDVCLTGERRILIVSGSNMSGKSTLLRTVGVNAVLAMAGAPVRARRLRISPMIPGASIRVLDSLQEGTSRFYAEITRLRKLVTLADGPQPLLFLLDELLHGTNSHDRRIGAEAVVKGLSRRGAFGLLTTHDLALAHIADSLAPFASNVHFEDHIVDGRIEFDYQLRPGVVKKSNALELMRSIGLEV
jgi:hypothetical protein